MSISQKTKDALAKKVGGQFNSKIKVSEHKGMNMAALGKKPEAPKAMKVIRRPAPTKVVVEEVKVEEIVAETPIVEATIVEPETVEETVVVENPSVEVFTKPVE